MTHSKEYMRAYREKNRERVRANQRRWYLENKDKAEAAMVRYRASGKEEITRRRRMSTDEYRRNALEKARRWASENPERYRANQAAYQTVRKRLGGKFKVTQELQSFYLNCPEDLEVDHVIPIRHENVCGLHVVANLQYLSRSDNTRKSNSFDGTYDNNGWNKNE